MNVVIISGTDRPNSYSLKISAYVKKQYDELGISAEILDLQDFPLQDVVGGRYGKEMPAVEEFRLPLLQADGLLFVIPEYNGSFPGILKMFVDYLPFPNAVENKPVAFIGESKGVFGGMRAVEQFQMVMNYRNAIQFPERVFIPKVHQEFDEKTGLKDDFKQTLLANQVQGFVKFINQIQGQEEGIEELS